MAFFPPPSKEQTSPNNTSGRQLGASLSCSKDTAVTCHFILMLPRGSVSASSYDALERAPNTSFITANLHVVQESCSPSARSHQLPTFIIMEISISHPDKHRLSPPPSVLLGVQALGEGPVKLILFIHTILILWL